MSVRPPSIVLLRAERPQTTLPGGYNVTQCQFIGKATVGKPGSVGIRITKRGAGNVVTANHFQAGGVTGFARIVVDMPAEDLVDIPAGVLWKILERHYIVGNFQFGGIQQAILPTLKPGIAPSAAAAIEAD